MSHRHLRRALAGLLGGLLAAAAPAALADDIRPAVTPPADAAEAVNILKAERDGQVVLNIRGQGEDRVKFSIKNTTDRRLKVILPPGLVASAATGQGLGGGGAGGFQSMGLGVPTNRPGSFGEFRGEAGGPAGFRSVPVDAVPADLGLTVPANASVDLVVPSVCLNFGVPTPTPRDQFRLVDVDDYTQDVRARKALRSLATLGTSQTVAQAVAWNVFNGMSFSEIVGQSVRKLNVHEVALAGRFVEALDHSGSGLVESASLAEGRLFVRVQGEGASAKEARELAEKIDGMRLLGLPLHVVKDAVPAAGPASIYLQVQLTPGETANRGKIVVRVKSMDNEWRNLATVPLKDTHAPSELRAETLVDAIDRSVAQAFVATKVAVKNPDATTFRIDNRLPFSLSRVTLQAGDRGVMVDLDGVGVGPLRSGMAIIPAAKATVERVELNGL